MPEKLLPIVKGTLRPSTWVVVCPICEGSIEIENVRDDDAGVFYARDEDCAPVCETCNVVVTSDGVALREIEAPYYQNDRW